MFHHSLPRSCFRQPHAVQRGGIRFWAIRSGWRKTTQAAALGIIWRGPELRLSVKSGGTRQRRRRDIAQIELIYQGAKAMRAAVPSSAGDGKVRLVGWDSGDRKFEIADAVQAGAPVNSLVHGRVRKRRGLPRRAYIDWQAIRRMV